LSNICEAKTKAMKNLISVLLGCSLLISACAQDAKYPNVYIRDMAGIFSPGEIKSLDSLVTAFEKETTNEIVVVTVTVEFAPVEKFDSSIIALHNQWGVGKKGRNNGVLIGICNDYRKIRISNGYGIEAKLTDEETKRIIDTIITPEYRQGRFYEGTRKGIIAIMKEIR
jgi:uncharacterized protein